MKKDSEFSLADAMERLEAIETAFQKPDLDLEDSLKKHAEAKELAEKIATYLHDIESSLETIDIASLKNA